MDSVVGRPLLRGAATLNGSFVPHGHESVSATGRFCAGHTLTLRWGRTGEHKHGALRVAAGSLEAYMLPLLRY